jgi:hypothetical protein
MSLANPVLGFIGIARIGTIGVGVHHAVPFPPHYLVVFCACFQLISEHGGHRWYILVSQHGGQHIDFDFHVDVLVFAIADVGWVWRIMLSSHEAKPAKARMPIPGDDDVVMDSNAEQLANLVNLLGHVDVGLGRGGVAGRMVVDEDAAGGLQFDGSS